MTAAGPLTLLLLLVSTAQARPSIFDWDDHRLFKHDELHDWLTDEQKAELEPLKNKHVEFRDKTLGFYNQLPKDEKAKWDNFYRKLCVVWLKDVASEDEIRELKELESKKTNKHSSAKSIHTKVVLLTSIETKWMCGRRIVINC
ncbi:DVA-1 polyprotein [Parelaphostrongylus tenuis]|uniref:DVA-1 polyprotein n=1 Tax=Parelaphostrongylus tenuis TaxID=148309 RepID=A0AAD5MT18_PARTN|nr:DVA-1 polyprotein [Parelaphostrongylus tenuis]